MSGREPVEFGVWRRFKDGESAKSIAKSLALPQSAILRMVLLTDREMGTSRTLGVAFIPKTPAKLESLLRVLFDDPNHHPT